jgi:hypothetical protein
MDSRTLATRRTLCRSCICGADFADPCATCEKGRWYAVVDCQKTPRAELPSVAAMAVTVTAAMAAEASAILRGVPSVADAEITRRLAVCAGCSEYLPEARRCQQCGCYLKFKTALRTANCPLGKW